MFVWILDFKNRLFQESSKQFIALQVFKTVKKLLIIFSEIHDE